MLRGIFGSKRNEAIESSRKWHNEELPGLYSSPNVTRIIKSKRMRWTAEVCTDLDLALVPDVVRVRA
jgi:hypothetical protein